jgi:hypothetical protein
MTQSQESYLLDLRAGPGAPIPTFVRPGESDHFSSSHPLVYNKLFGLFRILFRNKKKKGAGGGLTRLIIYPTYRLLYQIGLMIRYISAALYRYILFDGRRI